ncbi:hypothetical protein VNO78_21943 [Psophocarpus tetragonolobus]|uniref:Ribophorin II n=1 Tax=Psophocarpus tetragonolobus TaxID=3891 RepID=A0AAN9SDI1_PSOTE
MKKTVTNYVAGCLVCQQHKYLTSSPQGLLQPLSIPNAVWEEISMDFIVKLSKSNGYDAVMVVVDRLSKYGHFVPLKHPYSARTIANVFIREVARLHGIPASVVSDCDPLFMSIFWKELFKRQGTQLQMSTAYHPETDGQTEVLNRVLEGYLRCFCSEQPKGFIPGETAVEAVAQELQTRDEALKQLKFHLVRAQELMVEQKVGKVAYKLKLPTSARIHPVFHASQLKKAVGERTVEKELPKDLQGEGPSYWPTKVLDRRQIQRGDEEVPQVLVEWQEGGRDGATWENDFLGLVEKLFYLSGRYEIELTVGDAVMENSFLRLLGHVELSLPEAPEKAARPPPPPVDPYSRYGPKAEITHIFRAPEKRPPQELSLTFLGLVLLPFIGFLVGLLRSGMNLKNFPGSTLPATFAILFHLGIAAVLLLYVLFWFKLDLFTTLKAFGLLGAFLVFVGHRILSHLALTSAKLKSA